MRHVISIHHLYQTGLNVKDLYSIPDLSVAHWFRLRRNTHFWMEVRFFC